MKVVGVDASTNAFAYAVIEDGNLIEFDKISFTGGTIGDKLADAHAAITSISKHEPDLGVVESAVYVNNRSVVIKLAYFIGVALAGLSAVDATVDVVPPISWMSYIGNPNFTKAEKVKINQKAGAKNKSQQKKAQRDARKQKTKDIINDRFNVLVDDDDIADAIGVAIYGWEEIAEKQ